MGFYLYPSLGTICMQYPWRPEEGTGSSALELETVVSCRVDGGSLTLVRCKSGQCSLSLSRLSSAQTQCFQKHGFIEQQPHSGRCWFYVAN